MRGHSEFIVHAQSWRNLGALKARLANKPSTLLFENHMFLSRILLIVLGVTCLSYLYLFVSSMAGTSLASEECQVWSWNCEACAGRRCILTISDNIQFVGIEWNWYILTSESVLKDKLCNIFHKAPKFEEELKNWILLDLFFILHMNIYIYIIYKCIYIYTTSMQPSCAVSLFARMACRVEFLQSQILWGFFVHIEYDTGHPTCETWKSIRCTRLTVLLRLSVFVIMNLQDYLLCRYLAISICIRPTHFCHHQFCPSLRWSSSCIPQLWCKTRCFQANVLQHFGSERWRSCGHPEGKSNETSPLAHCTSIAPIISLHIYFGCFP